MRPGLAAATLCMLLPAAVGPAGAATHHVLVRSNVFEPALLTIEAGDTVTWSNVGGGHHNVVAENRSFNSGAPTHDFAFSHTFTSAGSFGYYCQPHRFSGMQGRVVAREAPGLPTAPGGLQAMALSTTEVALRWSDAGGETSYRVEARRLGEAAFIEVATAGGDATETTARGLAPGTYYTFRVQAENGAGRSPFSNEAGESTLAPAAPCVASETVICLNQGRFEVWVDWRTADANGPGRVLPIPDAPDSGLFYFFSAGNVELLVKVLDACVPPFDRYWVFFAATTNVELGLVVTDTQTGRRRYYLNPLGRTAPPVQDVGAFATCP